MATIEYAELARKLWPFMAGYVGQYSGGYSVLPAAAASTSTGGGAPSYASFLTLGTDADLSAERVFTPASTLTGTDAGAGSTYTLGVNQASAFTWTGTHTFSPAGGAVVLTDGKTLNGSTTFVSGFAGAGWRIDQGISYASQSTAEFDNLVVRGLMRVYELVINKIRVSRGSLIVSPGGGKVTAVTGSGPYTLTFDEDHGVLTNDLLRAQKFTGSGTYTSLLTVTAVPTSKTLTVTLSSGSAPAAGYEYAVVGNTSSSTRQGGLFLTADDSGAPFLDIYDGVAAHSDFNSYTKTKARLGKLTGITDSFFGTLTGYGLYTSRAYLNGAYINGSLMIGPGVGFTTTAMLYLAFDTPPTSGAAVVNTNGHLGQRAAVSGTVQGWPGLYGGCVDLSAGGYLSYNADNNIHSTSTISTWVYMSALPGAGTDSFIMSCSDTWAKGVNLWIAGSDGKLYFEMGNSGGSTTIINSTATFPTGAWTHVAATYVTGASMYLYINGVQVASTTSSVVAPYLLSSNNIVVGNCTSQGGTRTLRGYLDDFAIIRRQLSADEVTAIYRASAPLNVTRSGYELVLSDPSTAAKVVANAYGIFGTDASAKPTFSLVNVNSTVNGESLTTGDTMLGDNSSSKGNVLFDQSAGKLRIRAGTTDILSFSSTGSVDGEINFGSGGFYQGSSGSFGSVGTGIKMFKSTGVSDGAPVNEMIFGVYNSGNYSMSITPSAAITIVGDTSFTATRGVGYVDSIGNYIGHAYGYTDGSSINAMRFDAYSDDSAREPFIYVAAMLDDSDGTGTAAAQLIASKFALPNSYSRPTATISNFVNVATPLAAITLEVKSKVGSIASLSFIDSNGTITWSASGVSKSWRIDHPLKPTTHWLDHATVEGPDNYTFYRGNVTLDNTGHATVQMPDWFDALNDDLAITYGDWGDATRARTSHRIPNGWVIVGQPRQRVSWIASGLRADAWAKAHPFQVETEKDEDNYGKVFAWKEHGFDESFAPPSVADRQADVTNQQPAGQ